MRKEEEEEGISAHSAVVERSDSRVDEESMLDSRTSCIMQGRWYCERLVVHTHRLFMRDYAFRNVLVILTQCGKYNMLDVICSRL